MWQPRLNHVRPYLASLLTPGLHCPDSTESCMAGLASWFYQPHWLSSVSRAFRQVVFSVLSPHPSSLPFHIPFSERPCRSGMATPVPNYLLSSWIK